MDKLKINQTTWNLTPLFKNDNDPKMASQRKEVEKLSFSFINKWRRREDYLKDPQILKKALDEYETLMRKYGYGGDEGYYFELRSAQDQADPKVKAKTNKITEFTQKIQNDIAFFELNIAKIPPKDQKKFLTDKNLSSYKHFLEKLFAQSSHLLPEEQEKILNLKSTPSYENWVKMTSSFLSKEERETLLENGTKEKVTYETLLNLMSSKNKKVRDLAAVAFNDILNKYKEVATEEINSILLNKKIDDELRSFKRPDESRLLNDDMDHEVVDTLLEVVSSKNSIAKRYYLLKAKLLGVKKLSYHERNIEYGEIKGKFPFEKAVELVYKVFSNLDSEFAQIFKGFIENGQFDVFPRKNKRGGAACWNYLISQPTYIILNHTDNLNNVTTLAHETGHGINNELIRKVQHSLYFNTPVSTAEVASTFMEDFVLEEILKISNDQEKLAILMMKLNSDISTIFRQVACYKFEQDLHQEFRQKGYLSTEEIGKLFQKNMISYMGNGVEQSPGSENWWIYWSHIRTFFYVYSYASGLLISKALQNGVKKDPKYIEKVKEFLSAGTSDSSKNIFKKAGIDITKKEFWESGLKEIEDLLKETEKLAKRLGKI